MVPTMRPLTNRYCIWTQIRDESRNLKSFIEWHLSQGFEYFVIGDDRSVDSPREVLKEFIDKGIVSVYDASEHSENFGRFVGKSFFSSNDIIAFIDVDEFLRSSSGFAKTELDFAFINQDTDLVYLNWILRHERSLASSSLFEYRDSFPFGYPDIFTKYVVRYRAIQNLKESEQGCHFISGISSKRSVNGAYTEPSFIDLHERNTPRKSFRNNAYERIESPSTWQIPPSKPSLWLDHFFTRDFGDYFNYKSFYGNKNKIGFNDQIRGTGYFHEGLGENSVAPVKRFTSLNFCRLYPQIKRIDGSKSVVPAVETDKTVFLHMGLPKTGTTAFQRALADFSEQCSKSPIGYFRINGSDYEKEYRNGIDLTAAAESGIASTFRSTIDKYCDGFHKMDQPIQLISAEEFTRLNASDFGIIRSLFNQNGFSTCGIAVVRPFLDFATSFFKQYIRAHVDSDFHNLLTYKQIAESARLHVERLAVNCFLCDSYKVINYSRTNSANRIIEFIYQLENPIDLSDFEQIENQSISWQAASKLYSIRKSEALGNELESKEYLRLSADSYSYDTGIPISDPYYAVISQEQEKLKRFFSVFPQMHRWEHLFDQVR
jgi:hypothetical protein